MKKNQPLKSKMILIFTVLLSAFLTMQTTEVNASHFRGGSISWKQLSGNTVRFTVTSSWGSFVSTPFLNFGDGSPVSNVSHVQVSSGPGFVTYQGTIDHTYPNAGPWTAFWASGDRIAALQNAPSALWRVETRVCLTGNTGSPVSSVPAIVQMVASGQSFQLPAADPDGDQLIWSWATTAQTGIPTIPPAGFTISPTGLLTLAGGVWSAGQQFALVTNITEGTGGCGAKTVADFIVQIQAASSNMPPTCVLNGNATNNINVGVPFSISFTGTDPEGLFLTANPSSLPPGATIGPLSGVSPLTTTFNYTPTQAQANQSFAITLTYVDAGNLTSLCSFSITVGSGCTPPVISCPSTITVNNQSGQCGANVSFTGSNAATATGTSPTITYSPASGSFFPVGTTAVTATATNSCGTAQCTFTVTVVDNELPSISCAPNVTINNTPGMCSGTTTLTPPTVSDNCTSFNIAPEMIANGGFSSGASSWNACGNSVEAFCGETCYGGSNASNIVAEIDHQPVTLCQNISGFVNGKMYKLTFLASRRSGAPPTVGAIVTINGGALSATVNRTNTVFSLTPETFTFVATQTTHQLKMVPTSGWGGTLGFIVDDISIKEVTGTVTNDAPATYPVGNTTVTWTATDANNNSATCTQIVTVVDNQPPTITCPANTIINYGDDESPTANGTATATDNCPGVSVSSNDAISNGPNNNKTITRTWTATDGANNTATCNQTITVCDLGVSLGNDRYVFFGIPGSPGASGVITATPSGGLTGITYLWSSTDASVNGLTTQSVTPTGYTDAQAITYSVTATAPNGCTATDEVTITYFNINCSNNGNNVKVKVCHIPQGNPTNCNTICVSINAYQVLLDNGSYLGQCLPNCAMPPAARGVVDISDYIVGKQTLDVKVFNNPTQSNFRLYVYGDLYQKVSIRVMDMYGRVVDQKYNLNTEQEITVGDSYIAGVYMVEVMQGKNKKVVKLVKQ